MPAIGDLAGVRQRLDGGQGIGAAPVARDDGDLGLLAQPGLRGSRLAIRLLNGTPEAEARLMNPPTRLLS